MKHALNLSKLFYLLCVNIILYSIETSHRSSLEQHLSVAQNTISQLQSKEQDLQQQVTDLGSKIKVEEDNINAMEKKCKVAEQEVESLKDQLHRYDQKGSSLHIFNDMRISCHHQLCTFIILRCYTLFWSKKYILKHLRKFLQFHWILAMLYEMI